MTTRKQKKSTKIEKRLLRRIGWINREYNLIRPGDLIIVGVSGGKDSLSLILLLEKLRRRAPFIFNITGVTLDIGISRKEISEIKRWMEQKGISWEFIPTNIIDTINNVVPDKKSPCSACARFRRGILYNLAYEKKAVLALGHHADDAMETLLMNIFFSGKLQSMPPVLVSDDKRNRLIRPMLYCREGDLAEYAININAPVVGSCSCPGAKWVASSQRARMKEMISNIEKSHPDSGKHIIAAMANIKPSNLMDLQFWPFDKLNSAFENENISSNDFWKEKVEVKTSKTLGKTIFSLENPGHEQN